MRQRSKNPGRGAALMLPVLMLPLLLVTLWLAFAPHSSHAPLRITVGVIVAAVIWYLLGGALALAAVLERARARDALRALVPACEAAGEPIWASDAGGRVIWQNAAARLDDGDQTGEDIVAVLTRHSAGPKALVALLQRRAGPLGMAEASLGAGSLKLEAHAGGALQLWRRHAAPRNASVRPQAVVTGDAMEGLPVPLLRIGADGRVAAANPAAVQLLGAVPADATMAALFDGLGRPVEEWVDDVLHARTEARPEVLHRRGDGPALFVQVSLRPEPGGGLLAVLSDASALKTLEAQFVQSQKMQAIGQLAGGIAHDFNNLLTAISGHVDLLMLRHDKADPNYADLDQIRQNANRAAALVSQLLAFSRKQTLKPQLLDPRDTLSDLMHLLNRLVGERVILSFEHDPALNPIRADRRQFEQVVMNLVVNARDAMPEGGRIAIHTANVTIGRNGARARGAASDRVAMPPGRYVRVTVTDEGVGIPPDIVEKIFEPFFTTKRTGEGTGLGLATVYGIVKQTGGYVFCDSTVGQGTSFSLWFPAHDRAELAAAVAEEAAATAAPIAAAAPRPRPGTVLLVEDETPVRAFASRALKLKGFEVLEADCAEAALSLLADSRQQIDVFVTDVVMPGMDGPSWVRAALRDRPGTRVVFISGYAEDIFEDGRDPVAGAVFLQKPFSLVALTDTVLAQMSARAADVAAGTGAAPGAADR